MNLETLPTTEHIDEILTRDALISMLTDYVEQNPDHYFIHATLDLLTAAAAVN